MRAPHSLPVPARAEPEFELRPDFGKRFEEVGTQGVFVAYRLRDNRLIVTDEGRARREYVPASTYKVPHALIALETGVVADADKELIRWDGQVRSIEAWNKDHTLRSAIAVSAVPVFQQIALRIGSERMKKYLDAFDYGNREVGSQIDRFWLDGPLKISALEQIEFFERLRRGDLPLSQRSLDIGRDIIPSESVSGGFAALQDRCRRHRWHGGREGGVGLGRRLCRSRRGFIDLRAQSRHPRPARSGATAADRQGDHWQSWGRFKRVIRAHSQHANPEYLRTQTCSRRVREHPAARCADPSVRTPE